MTQYAENGEDTFLMEYIEKNNLQINKLIVDIGAYDGVFFSNSCAFIEDGWRGALVEPHPTSFGMLQDRYKDNENVVCFNYAITKERGVFGFQDNGDATRAGLQSSDFNHKVHGFRLSELFENITQPIGILSIDAEGHDTEIIGQLIYATEVRPQIIVVESNSLFDRSEQIELLNDEYYLIGLLGVNTIWLLKQLKNE